MPPKKKAAAKSKKTKTDAPSTPIKSTRATGRAAPETVMTRRGKEYDTTAAASRPTRAAVQTDLSFPDTAPVRRPNASSTVKSTFTKRSAPATAVEPPKKRGRPAKAKVVASPKRGRGRPAKSVSTPAAAASATPAKRGPGRPRKGTNVAPKAKAASKTRAAPPPEPATGSRKRGRPAKETVEDAPPPKKRGRPSKTSALTDAVPPEGEQPTPRKRGQPPYGGETTKIDSDDEAAAEQLEEELLDEADDDDAAPVDPPVKPSRGRPAGKGKGKQATAPVVDDATSTTGQQFWLMKAEQDGRDEILANGKVFNTKFTIDDLRAKNGPEPWDGVRSAGAAKNMRAMRTGDLAFFYGSGGKMPGITGLMEIVSEAEPDVTVSDPNSYGYVEKEKDRGKWCVVHVEFRKKLKKPVTRAQLIAGRDAGPLANLQEFVAARLSVSKVSQDEWDYISSLIEGFDDDDEEEEEEATNGNGGAMGEFDVAMDEEEADLPSLPAKVPTAIMSVEQQEPPTTDSIFPPVDVVETSVPITAISSRPTSRGSRAGSASRTLALAPKTAGSSRAGSRAGSVSRTLAPPSSRARSKTPQARAGSVQPPSSGALMDAIGEE